MRRSKRDRDKTTAADGRAFKHSSQNVDLAALVADHLIDKEDAEATATWHPSRRGNSPRNAAKPPAPPSSEP